MFRPRTGRTPRVASLALAVLLMAGSSVATAAERDDDGGDGGSTQSTEGGSPDFMSGDFDALGDALGMRVERTMGQQLRLVSFQVLGTAAVGGLVLSQLDGVRRRAVLPPARLHAIDPKLEIAGGPALEDEPIVTPEPGTVVLTGTGLALVFASAVVRRRRSGDVARIRQRR